MKIEIPSKIVCLEKALLQYPEKAQMNHIEPKKENVNKTKEKERMKAVKSD